MTIHFSKPTSSLKSGCGKRLRQISAAKNLEFFEVFRVGHFLDNKTLKNANLPPNLGRQIFLPYLQKKQKLSVMGNYVNNNLIREEKVEYETTYHWIIFLYPKILSHFIHRACIATLV
jgi:hypothetical protein